MIGSGDNHAAFALAGLGRAGHLDRYRRRPARGRRRSRAGALGLDIRFLHADAADLGALDAESFDLVVSTNGFFVWIADLAAVFGEVHRILEPGGRYLFYDVHPFQRPWKGMGATSARRETLLGHRGPSKEDGQRPSFEFNWTLADLLNQMVEQGLQIEHVLESPARDGHYWRERVLRAERRAATARLAAQPAGRPSCLADGPCAKGRTSMSDRHVAEGLARAPGSRAGTRGSPYDLPPRPGLFDTRAPSASSRGARPTSTS